jgi:mannose-1-phosphate guanylyltransferase
MVAAMVLCAGLGTRLRPLTDHLPKPLLPVGDRPALGHILSLLRGAGFERAVINTHHRAQAFEPFFAEFDLPVDVMHEPAILGTAGGLANARDALGRGDVLVWNGDIVLGCGAPPGGADHARRLITDLLQHHDRWSAGERAVATWAVAPRPPGEGTVGLDDRGCVVRLRGRVWGREHAGGDFLGIQVITEAMRRALPKAGCVLGDVAMPLLDAGAVIATLSWSGGWDDIGSPAALLSANLRWLEARGEGSFCGSGAEVDDRVVLLRSIVGRGAAVGCDPLASTKGGHLAEPSPLLREVMVLPGATAVAPLSRAIVGMRAVVRVG